MTAKKHIAFLKRGVLFEYGKSILFIRLHSGLFGVMLLENSAEMGEAFVSDASRNALKAFRGEHYPSVCLLKAKSENVIVKSTAEFLFDKPCKVGVAVARNA